MSEFKYCLEISSKDVICLGDDFQSILELLPNCENCCWYVFDVERSDSDETDFQTEFKDKSSLIDFVSSVDQFYWGVFLCLDRKILLLDTDDLCTEDPKFRNNLNALLELRAFDTSYIEVYSDDDVLLKNLEKKLNEKTDKYQFRLFKNLPPPQKRTFPEEFTNISWISRDYEET